MKKQTYYERNKDEYLKKLTESKNNRKQYAREQVLELLKKSQCMDCGNEDIRVMEFDHVRGEKKANVSRMIQRAFSWAKIQEEIDKCDIVCANCHRIRSFSRTENYRTIAIDNPE